MRGAREEQQQQTSPTCRRFEWGPGAQPLRLDEHRPPVCGHAWRPPTPAAVLVLLHGLQSHSEWFAEAAELLCARGFAVYALDRRGSGSSPAPRGDIRRYADWFEEVGAVLDHVRALHPGVPTHLVGHCFGGAIALGSALRYPRHVASLVMLTPGLYVLPDYGVAEKLGILACGLLAQDTRFRVPQDDDMFSRDPEVVAWIGEDALGARTVTARCLLQTARMMSWLRRHVGELRVPLLVVEATRDRIADNRRNRALLDRALGDRWERLAFDAEHLLVAEPCRDALLDSLAGWTGRAIRATP